MAETQMCLACSVNPALPGKGTVPLCAACKSQATDKRGVKFERPSSEADPLKN